MEMPDFNPDVIGDVRDEPEEPEEDFVVRWHNRAALRPNELDDERTRFVGFCEFEALLWDDEPTPVFARPRRSHLQAAPAAAQRRQTAARNRREQRRARAALDARWVWLPSHFNPDSRKLPYPGRRVLLLGWVEVFHDWPYFAENPTYRPVEVIRIGEWWSSIEHFTNIEHLNGDGDLAMCVKAWQPIPPDAERWIEATPVPKENEG